MKKLTILLILFSIFQTGHAQEKIRGLFFENKTPHMIGVRLVNRYKRYEKHYLFDPQTNAHVDTKLDSFTLSAQVITPSFPIDCCEWKTLHNGQTLSIVFDEKRNRCYCEIKN